MRRRRYVRVRVCDHTAVYAVVRVHKDDVHEHKVHKHDKHHRGKQFVCALSHAVKLSKKMRLCKHACGDDGNRKQQGKRTKMILLPMIFNVIRLIGN